MNTANAINHFLVGIGNNAYRIYRLIISGGNIPNGDQPKLMTAGNVSLTDAYTALMMSITLIVEAARYAITGRFVEVLLGGLRHHKNQFATSSLNKKGSKKSKGISELLKMTEEDPKDANPSEVINNEGKDFYSNVRSSKRESDIRTNFVNYLEQLQNPNSVKKSQ